MDPADAPQIAPPLQLRGREVSDDELLHPLLVVRALETAIMEAYLADRFEGPLHVSLGQEAVAVGVMAALGLDDVVVSNHRGHGHALAFGLDPRRVVAEIVCDPRGYAGGRGGSMHIYEPSTGFLGTNGIVGDGAGLGLGAALALQQLPRSGIAVSMFGDGAMGTGIVYEALNIAQLWALPIVFVCENNGYAEMTPTDVHLSSAPHERAAAFGLEASCVDGDDVLAVRDATTAAARQARDGQPVFLELRTHRWTGHYVGDPGRYRPEGEAERWRAEHCPIQALARALDHPDDLEATYTDAARDLVGRVLGDDTHATSG